MRRFLTVLFTVCLLITQGCSILAEDRYERQRKEQRNECFMDSSHPGGLQKCLDDIDRK